MSCTLDKITIDDTDLKRDVLNCEYFGVGEIYVTEVLYYHDNEETAVLVQAVYAHQAIVDVAKPFQNRVFYSVSTENNTARYEVLQRSGTEEGEYAGYLIKLSQRGGATVEMRYGGRCNNNIVQQLKGHCHLLFQ